MPELKCVFRFDVFPYIEMGGVLKSIENIGIARIRKHQEDECYVMEVKQRVLCVQRRGARVLELGSGSAQ